MRGFESVYLVSWNFDWLWAAIDYGDDDVADMTGAFDGADTTGKLRNVHPFIACRDWGPHMVCTNTNYSELMPFGRCVSGRGGGIA